MTEDNELRSELIAAALGFIPVIWIALLLAPYAGGGLPSILENSEAIFASPFNIKFCSDSLKCCLILGFAYALGIGIYLSTKRNYRRGEEHGSAKWGNPIAISKKYKQSPDTENKILTQNVSIGFDAHRHRRNLNILVCGGSGAGKTRFFAKPNIMQANSSLVILDPKGADYKGQIIIHF